MNWVKFDFTVRQQIIFAYTYFIVISFAFLVSKFFLSDFYIFIQSILYKNIGNRINMLFSFFLCEKF